LIEITDYRITVPFNR